MVRPSAPSEVPFHRSYKTGKELEYVGQAIETTTLVGDGPFTLRASQTLQDKLGAKRVLLTPSCTAALEMAALLCRPGGPGDSTSPDPGEVIVPAFTFVSTANAFLLHGYRPVFVDVLENGNLDPASVERAITPATRVVVPVHYAGVAAEMDAIMALSQKHGFLVVEDAAQAIFATYKGQHLGTLGHLGAFSFHGTKNLSCGEGGALVINDERYTDRAEHIREKGTNRTNFMRGEINRYTWIDIGASYLCSDLQAAYLLAQLEGVDVIQQRRAQVYQRYQDALAPLAQAGHLKLPEVPKDRGSNHHLFHILVDDPSVRDRVISHLRAEGIGCAFHYVPLHLSEMGRRLGGQEGSLPMVESIASRLVRLPLYPDLTDDNVDRVAACLESFFR